MAAITRLGVLGGTFDPIHIGHLLMAQTAYDALNLDLVLLVPAGVPPHKRKQEREDAAARLEMVERAIAGDSRFAVSTVDLEREPPHFTKDTLSILRERYNLGADEIFFILGSDSLEQLPHWCEPESIARQSVLAVIRRPGYRLDLEAVQARVPALEGRVRVIEMPGVGVSSSWIRDTLRAGQSVRYWVPQEALQLIEERSLYRMPAGERS